MGHRRAKGGVTIAALIANRQAEQGAAAALDDLLGAAHKSIQFFTRASICIVVNPLEAQEQRRRAAQLGEEGAQPGLLALINGLQQPGPRLKIVCHGWKRLWPRAYRERLHHPKPCATLRRRPGCADLHIGFGPVQRGLVSQHLAALGQALALGHARQGSSGQGIEQLDARVADHEAPHCSRGQRNLQLQGRGCAIRQADLGAGLHGSLHIQGRGQAAVGRVFILAVCARPLRFAEPAGDRIARKADHAAPVLVHYFQQGIVNDVQIVGQHFHAAARPQALRQNLGQRGEA